MNRNTAATNNHAGATLMTTLPFALDLMHIRMSLNRRVIIHDLPSRHNAFIRA